MAFAEPMPPMCLSFQIGCSQFLFYFVLPSEKSILPYFSVPRGVAISVPFPEVRNRKGTESGLEIVLSVHLQIFILSCITVLPDTKGAAVPAVLVAKELLLTQVP